MSHADPLTDPPHHEHDDEDDGDTIQDTIRRLPLWWHVAGWTAVGILVGGLLLGPMLAPNFHH